MTDYTSDYTWVTNTKRLLKAYFGVENAIGSE